MSEIDIEKLLSECAQDVFNAPDQKGVENAFNNLMADFDIYGVPYFSRDEVIDAIAAAGTKLGLDGSQIQMNLKRVPSTVPFELGIDDNSPVP